MQIGEAIAVSMVSQEGDSPCWFCEEEPTWESRTNDETAEPDTSDSESEDGVPENDEDNSSSKLGENLPAAPGWTIKCPATAANVSVVAAAHHCIPGGASLAKATDLHDFMRKDGPFSHATDIGYGVNHARNGVWLPGNYGVRRGKDHYTADWSGQQPSFKTEYANRAMARAGAQFHDAHSKYNKNVLQTLESVSEKLGEPEQHCPVCSKKLKHTRPPYGLVGRLDFSSGEHRTMITTLGSEQKAKAKSFVQQNYYTSSRVRTYLGMP
jgi:hypothetical protein